MMWELLQTSAGTSGVMMNEWRVLTANRQLLTFLPLPPHPPIPPAHPPPLLSLSLFSTACYMRKARDRDREEKVVWLGLFCFEHCLTHPSPSPSPSPSPRGLRCLFSRLSFLLRLVWCCCMDGSRVTSVASPPQWGTAD